MVLIVRLIPRGFFRKILPKNRTSNDPSMEAPKKHVIITVEKERKMLYSPPSISDLNFKTEAS